MHLVGNSATSYDQRIGRSLAFQQQHLWRSLKHQHWLFSSRKATVAASSRQLFGAASAAAAVKRSCGSTSTTATVTCAALAATTRRQRLRQQWLRAAGVSVCRLCGRLVSARAQGRSDTAAARILEIKICQNQ
jgi:hypothetical protein